MSVDSSATENMVLELAPVPAPLPKKIGYTPESLLAIWQEKLPWLKDGFRLNSELMKVTPAGTISYSIQPHWREAGVVLLTSPKHKYHHFRAQPDDEYDVDEDGNEIDDSSSPPDLVVSIPQYQNNEYEFTFTTHLSSGLFGALLAKTKGVGLQDVMEVGPRLTKCPPAASADLRLKLFYLMQGMVELQIGGDPEFFSVVNPPTEAKQTRGHEEDYDRPRWEADGFAWEYHPGPARCFQSLMGNWEEAVSDDADDLGLTTQPRLDITPEILAMVSPEQQKLGCNPSNNVYKMTGDLATASTLPYRWAGGHLHFALPKNRRSKAAVELCVRNLDAIFGPCMVSMIGHWDDPERRRYYGLAGEYRSKPYGFEYRTPSNQMWMTSTVFYALAEIARAAVKLGVLGLSWEDIGMDTSTAEIIACINDNNIDLARAIIHRNMPVYWALISSKSSITPYGGDMLRMILREKGTEKLTEKDLSDTLEAMMCRTGQLKDVLCNGVTWPDSLGEPE